jgi:hypothetical protein
MKTLDKIINSTKCITAGLAVMALTGCAMTIPIRENSKTSVVVGADIMTYNAKPGKAIQTLDGATTDMGNKYWLDVGPKVGLKREIGRNKKAILNIGADARFNLSYIESNTKFRYHDVQAYTPEGSEIFTQVYPGAVTFIPYFESQLLTKPYIGAQVGFAITDWTAENGTLGRGDKQEPRTKETESALGIRFGLNIPLVKDQASLLLFYEGYGTEFADDYGSIDLYGACFNLEY